MTKLENMILLEGAVKSIIADTRRNKLVWEPSLPNVLKTNANLGGYLERN